MSSEIKTHDSVIKEIEIDGAICNVVFNMINETPVVAIDEAGMFLFETDDRRAASKRVAKVVSRHRELFDNPEISVDAKIASTDGKYYKRSVFTRRGLMLLAMKTRSTRGHLFCLAASKVMEELLSGNQVAAKVSAPPTPSPATNEINSQLLEIIKQQISQPSPIARQLLNEVAELKEEVKQLKTKASTPIDLLPGERRAVSVARKAGWCSKKGKPHAQAVLVAAINNGLNTNNKCLRKATFLIETNSHGLRPQETLVFTEKGAALFLDEIESLYRGDSFTVRPNYIARQQGRSRDQHVVRGVCI